MPAPTVTSDIRDELTRFLAHLLQIPASEIDPETRFLDLGADSIMLASAADWLEKRFGVQLPMERFFTDLSTTNALAAFLGHPRQPQGPSEGPSPAAAVVQAGSEPARDVAPVGADAGVAAPAPIPDLAPDWRAEVADRRPDARHTDAALFELMHAQLQLVRQLVTEQNQLLATATPRLQEGSDTAGGSA